MAGTIIPGQKGRATDFINESEKNATPANDAGRVPKLESDAKISREFIHRSGKSVLTAGEAITGATTPQACFIMSEQRRNKYQLVAKQNQSASIDFEMYKDAGANDRRTGQKFNAGLFSKITAISVSATREGSISSHSYICEIYAQDGSGFPTGAALGSQAFTSGADHETSAGEDHLFIQFATPVTVTPGADYVVVLRETTTTGSSTLNFHINYYSSTGIAGAVYSTNGGSSWSNGNGSDSSSSWSKYVIYGHKNKTAGAVYLSDGDDPDLNYFDGFVNQTVSAGASVNLYWGTEVLGFTSLLPGTHYYLSTTPGAITDTPAKGKKVGKALSASSISPSDKPEFSDVYQDLDFSTYQNAVADCYVEIVGTIEVSIGLTISKYYHRAMFRYNADNTDITVYSAGNSQGSHAVHVKQREYIYMIGVNNYKVRYNL